MHLNVPVICGFLDTRYSHTDFIRPNPIPPKPLTPNPDTWNNQLTFQTTRCFLYSGTLLGSIPNARHGAMSRMISFRIACLFFSWMSPDGGVKIRWAITSLRTHQFFAKPKTKNQNTQKEF
jgi:hypothetical protein